MKFTVVAKITVQQVISSGHQYVAALEEITCGFVFALKVEFANGKKQIWNKAYRWGENHLKIN